MRKYYVYMILCPKTKKCIYIGKGTGERVFRQVFNINGEEAHLYYSKGGDIDGLYKILHHRLTEEEAYELERIEIMKRDESEDLLNYRRRGVKKSKEWKQKISKSNKKTFAERDNSDRKGGKNSNASKCVYIPDNKEFGCLLDLCNEYNLPYRSILGSFSNLRGGRIKKSKYSKLIKFI